MGIITERAKQTFDLYRQGNIEKFIKELVDMGDVMFQWQRDLVDDAIEYQIKKLKKEGLI